MAQCRALVHETGMMASFPCHRDAKPGEQYCGPHLAGRRRSEVALAASLAKSTADSERWRRIMDAQERLDAAVQACPHCRAAWEALQAAKQR